MNSFTSIFNTRDAVKNAVQFMIQFFKYKNIKLVTFFMCWNSYDINYIQKNMWTHELRTSYISPFNYLFSNKSNSFAHFNKHGWTLDFSCNYSVEFLRTISDENTFQASNKWLILYPESRNEIARNVIKSLHARLDSDITLAAFNERQRQFILYDVYNVGGQSRVSCIGFWRKNLSADSLQITSNVSSYRARMNMSDVHLRATTVVTRSKNYQKPLEEYLVRRKVVNYDSMTKIFYALFVHLKDIHNFNYTLKYTNAWYGTSKGGNDGGLSRELSEGLTDIAASGATMTKERVEFTDYSIDAFHFKTCFIFRDTGIFKNDFIRVFPIETWLSLFAMVVLISLSIKYTYSYGRSRKCSLTEACLITLGGLCSQGSSYRPGNTKSKCVLLSLLLMSTVLYNCYSTVIVSKLLNSRSPSVTSLNTLLKSDIQLGAEDIIYLHQIFKIRNNSEMRKLHKKLQAKPGDSTKLYFFSVKEGVRKVQEERFAYHSAAETLYPTVSRTFEPSQICDLSEICIHDTKAYFMWKKNSEYKKMFSISYRRMTESGLLQRQRLLWQAKKPPCISGGNFVTVGMERISLAFYIIAAGVVVALILFLLEITYHKIQK